MLLNTIETGIIHVIHSREKKPEHTLSLRIYVYVYVYVSSTFMAFPSIFVVFFMYLKQLDFFLAFCGHCCCCCCYSRVLCSSVYITNVYLTLSFNFEFLSFILLYIDVVHISFSFFWFCVCALCESRMSMSFFSK